MIQFEAVRSWGNIVAYVTPSQNLSLASELPGTFATDSHKSSQHWGLSAVQNSTHKKARSWWWWVYIIIVKPFFHGSLHFLWWKQLGPSHNMRSISPRRKNGIKTKIKTNIPLLMLPSKHHFQTYLLKIKLLQSPPCVAYSTIVLLMFHNLIKVCLKFSTEEKLQQEPQCS